jgi:saccharopine dehydrogenase-like NADP-dependent oxidoreductase
MERIVVVGGAGAQGAACVSILANATDTKKIILADYDIDQANKVSKKIGSNRVTVKQVDAADVESLAGLFQGADTVINLVAPVFNDGIMKACAIAGANYIDTSVGEILDLDIHAGDNVLSRIMLGKEPKYDKEFKEKNITCLMGCGASPGLTNVLARYLSDKLDSVDSIKVRLVRKSLTESGIIKPWSPSWSPQRALWGYGIKPIVFADGSYESYPIYSGYEEYEFHEEMGIVPCVYHMHPEQVTLPHYIKKGIKNCDFKYTIDTEIGTLIKMGFADPDKKINLNGMEVVPRDLILKLVQQPRDKFLLESEDTAGLPFEVMGAVAVEVSGIKSGKHIGYKITYNINFFDSPRERVDIFRKYGATNIYVALPAIVGALLIKEGKTPSGVIHPECLEPELFLRKFSEIGPKLKLYETSYASKSVSDF